MLSLLCNLFNKGAVADYEANLIEYSKNINWLEKLGENEFNYIFSQITIQAKGGSVDAIMEKLESIILYPQGEAIAYSKNQIAIIFNSIIEMISYDDRMDIFKNFKVQPVSAFKLFIPLIIDFYLAGVSALAFYFSQNYEHALYMPKAVSSTIFSENNFAEFEVNQASFNVTDYNEHKNQQLFEVMGNFNTSSVLEG